MEDRLKCDYVYLRNTRNYSAGDICNILCFYDKTKCHKHNEQKKNYQKKYQQKYYIEKVTKIKLNEDVQ